MKWKSLGLVWKPDRNCSWQHSHGGLPTPVNLGNGVTRVFIYCQSSDHVGRIGYINVATENPIEVIGSSTEPVLDIGPPGAFDDHGVVPVSVVNAPNGRLFLYYVGFEICHRIGIVFLRDWPSATIWKLHFEKWGGHRYWIAATPSCSFNVARM